MVGRRRTTAGTPHERSRAVSIGWLAAGAGGAFAARALLAMVLLRRFRRDMAALNAGDYQPVISHYAEDAVLRFNEGEHRWSGEHRGKPAIARFLRNFINAGLEGQIEEILLAGAPWRLTIAARVSDHAREGAGKGPYRNHVVLLARTRWGRIVWHEDFYEDTKRIEALERRLSERGVAAVD